METAAAAAAAAAIPLFIPSSFLISRSPKLWSLVSKSVIPGPLFSSTSAYIREPIIRFKTHKTWRFPPSSCTSPYLNPEPSRKLGLLMEVDGVLADVYRLGNCQAFNVAFQKLGLDCANWTEPIFADLKRKAAGDEERMLILFFNRIGWPTSLPTNEKETFLKSIMREKRKALEDFAMSRSLALRPGVEKFIDEAIQEGLPLVLLTAYSKNGDEEFGACTGGSLLEAGVCQELSLEGLVSIIEKLGHDRTLQVKVVGKDEVQQSYYGQLVLGEGVSSSLDEQLVKEARKAVSMEKQRVAEEVASILKLSVDIDTTSTESTDLVVATLRAGAEYAGLPVQSCVLIAGSQSGVVGAERIGIPSVVIRSSSTARAEFRRAKAVMDGFGGADLTVSKLLSKRFTDPS
ncbi:hypothetical protein IEQ34_002250 [Dendrobium chrysotoxum]|uniref:Haloacid dehalogenase-like hydrolase domain-containing protein n=1 Tax=Dendrobium chrysotoxum TaxID=161865 RepID=A0AAV7HLQ6_DENCH|nr:hypothetical protein IEQ34_002250 [Dendrobium chrysotoxum]